MSDDSLTLAGITSDIKLILENLDNCRDKEDIAVFIYGIYRAQKENPDITIEEAIQSSITDWVDLF